MSYSRHHLLLVSGMSAVHAPILPPPSTLPACQLSMPLPACCLRRLPCPPGCAGTLPSLRTSSCAWLCKKAN